MVSHSLPHRACQQHTEYVIFVVAVSTMDSASLQQELLIQHKIISFRSLEAGRPKRLYFVSSGVKHLLQNDDREALKVTMTGLKVFERQELKVGHVFCRQCTLFRLPTLASPVCALAEPQAFVCRCLAYNCIDTCSSLMSTARSFQVIRPVSLHQHQIWSIRACTHIILGALEPAHILLGQSSTA